LFILSSLTAIFLGATIANAQYTADFQTNIISAVTSNWEDYTVGSNTSFDVLIIENKADVFGSRAEVGLTEASSNNSVLVTDPGSYWSPVLLSIGDGGSGNSLVISNGATLVSGGTTLRLGVSSNSCNNRVTVTGTGSVLSCGYGGYTYVGYYGSNNTVQLEDGGQLQRGFYDYPYIGYAHSSWNNSFIVTGHNTVYSNGVYVGYYGSGNSMIISNGAQVVGGYVAYRSGSSNNSVIVTGPGSIWNNGSLDLGRAGNGTGSYNRSNSLVIADGGLVNIVGNLTIESSNVVRIANNGSLVVSVDNNGSLLANGVITLNANNFANSGTFSLSGGFLSCSGLSFAYTTPPYVPFQIGNGTDLATYHMAGGQHSFAYPGLEISSNGFLTGCGTLDVSGHLVIDAGGTLLADCGGTLTFWGGTVTNNGVIRVTNGSVLESYPTVVNNGLIDIMSGRTNFHAAFINNGTVVDASYFKVASVAPSSNDFNVTWTTVGGRSYAVQGASSADGSFPTNFTDISPVFAMPGTSLGTTNYVDSGALTNASSRFYRVRLVP
jgi:T5SS/PEP-CTERM-associated repeat protein